MQAPARSIGFGSNMIFVAKRKSAKIDDHHGSRKMDCLLLAIGQVRLSSHVTLCRRRIGMRDVLIIAMGMFVVLVLVAGAAMWSMGLPHG
jgi:hypothetical protein